jgi:hypothetical protein
MQAARMPKQAQWCRGAVAQVAAWEVFLPWTEHQLGAEALARSVKPSRA